VGRDVGRDVGESHRIPIMIPQKNLVDWKVGSRDLLLLLRNANPYRYNTPPNTIW
jgi:hypothetical protein